MKFKYYLRGMGIGIILTAIVMGFALGGRKPVLSDAEVITRARALGMVEGDSGVLNDPGQKGESKDEKNAASSGEALAEEGGKVSKEKQQEVALSDTSISEVAPATQEGKGKKEENTKTANESKVDNKTKETGTAGSAGINENEVQTNVSAGNAGTDANTEQTTNTPAEQAKATAQQSQEPAAQTTAPAAQTQADAQQTAASEAQATPAAAPEQSTSGQAETAENQPAANAQTAPPASPQAPAEAATVLPTGPARNVTIPSGVGSDAVARILFNEGFVDDAVAYNNYLVSSGKDRRIRSGVKRIPEGASYDEIAAIITSG